MAKIYGIEIKNMKTFTGQEGKCLQGSIYYNGKRIGTWSQDSCGGSDIFSFDKSIIEDACIKFYNSDMINSQYKDLIRIQDVPDILMGKLIELKDSENTFAKGKKIGYQCLVEASDGFTVNGYYSRDSKPEIEKSQKLKDFCEECKSFFIGDCVIKIYDSFSDFDIE